jgi:hypothetical protein
MMKRIIILLVSWFLPPSAEASPTWSFVKSPVIDNPHGNDVVSADFGGNGMAALLLRTAPLSVIEFVSMVR